MARKEDIKKNLKEGICIGKSYFKQTVLIRQLCYQ